MKDRINQIMKDCGMNQKEFALKTGISTATVSSIFNGHTSATLNHVLALLKAFPNLNSNWLMFGEGNMYLGDNSNDARGSENGDLFANAEVAAHIVAPTAESPQPTSVGQFGNSTVVPSVPISPVKEVREVVKYIDKPQRKIREIRIFFDDGTYEVFSPSQN